jgi:glucose/arabinose dehydrogenase
VICDVLRNVSDRGLRVALWLSLIAFATTLSLQKILSLDYWWHLRAGAFIAETLAVPLTDPFTFTEPDAPWINIHWLHQLWLYAFHSVGGHGAVVLSKLVLVLGVVALLASLGYRRERPVITVVALALMLAIACPRFMPRPELPSFVLLAASLALYDRFERRGDAWIYGVAGVQLLWVNFHGLFALGIALCSLHLLAEISRTLLGRGDGVGWDRVRRLAAVLVLAMLATVVNPNLLDGALYPLHQLGMVSPSAEARGFGPTVAELARTFGPESAVAPLRQALFIVLSLLSFGAMALNVKRLRGSDPLVWGAFLFLALGAHRNLPLFAVVATPIFVRNANALLDRRAASVFGHKAAAAIASLALIALSFDVASDRFYPRVGVQRESGIGIAEELYPIAALDWIERERPPGPLCHHMADGGYVIWRLFPDYLAMTGGWRLEATERRRVMRFQVTTPERFERLDRSYRFGTVLVHHALLPADRLIAWLNRSWRWRLGFVDDVAAVYVRVSESELLREESLDPGAAGVFPALGERASPSDLRQRVARAGFYRAVGRYNLALKLWRDTIARYPESAWARLELSRLLRITRRTDEADAVLHDLLEEQPDSAEIRLELGDVRLAQGDRSGAREAWEAALAVNPRNAAALKRVGAIAGKEGKAELADLLTEIASRDRLRALVESGAAILLGVVLWIASLGAHGFLRPSRGASLAVWIAGIGLVVGLGSPVRAAGEDFRVERVATGLSLPLYLTAPPDDPTRVFIVEQRVGSTGRIRVLELPSLSLSTFVEIPGLATGNEQGLLGMAFHPDYASNGFFYVNYTDAGDTTQIVRYQVSGMPDLADAGSATAVLAIAQPQPNHNGGWMGFGPDGLLYIASGDGGGSSDNDAGHTAGTGNGQDTTDNLLGKILRIDVDGDDFPADPSRNYAIPASNPFVGSAGDDEIWSYGLRNPWRASFDRETGDLYIADVGQAAREEIDVQPAASSGGENYGWRLREGVIATTAGGVGGASPPGAIDPIYDYAHGGGDTAGNSVTGGYVYRGSADSLRGEYFFADFINDRIWSLRWDGSNPSGFDGTNTTSFTDWSDDPVFAPDQGIIENVTSFGEDAAGNLYIVTRGGDVFRITPVTSLPALGLEWVAGLALLLAGLGLRTLSAARTDGGRRGVRRRTRGLWCRIPA